MPDSLQVCAFSNVVDLCRVLTSLVLLPFFLKVVQATLGAGVHIMFAPRACRSRSHCDKWPRLDAPRASVLVGRL